ncbi:MAG: ATP-binding protein [Alphaproteobacteria bacterium]|nr:ATP-binding protein [Alphaproteobacteria bacterium]
MQRHIQSFIKDDSNQKMILLSGPRQTGKTTLTKNLFDNCDFLNFDLSEDREMIFKNYWNRQADAIILDELHKMPQWKRWIKGIYDTEQNNPRLIVTGSAQFDTFRKVGDSLAGRYFLFRLHPIDIQEACLYWNNDPIKAMENILLYSGFPEPFLRAESDFYRRWQKSHLDIILRQDLLDLYAVRHIKMLEIMVDLLKLRTGSPLSHASLARDVQVDHKTIKNWIQMLENIYAVFRVTPYHHNIARSILKEPKIYFFDIARIKDPGAQLENLVACALLKAIHFLEDTKGYKGSLHYLRTKDGHEIDFCVCIDDKPILAIEVKTTTTEPSSAFRYFHKTLLGVRKVQLVKNLHRAFTSPDGIEVLSLPHFLKDLDLLNFL